MGHDASVSFLQKNIHTVFSNSHDLFTDRIGMRQIVGVEDACVDRLRCYGGGAADKETAAMAAQNTF